MFGRKDSIEATVQQTSKYTEITGIIDRDPKHEVGEYRIRAVDGLKYIVQRKTKEFGFSGISYTTWKDTGFGSHDTVEQARHAFEHLMQAPVYLGKPDD